MGDHDQDDVVRRLRSLGSQPVEPGVADRNAPHLAAAAPATAHRRRRPVVTAAFVAGVILGGTGLAAALPGPPPTQAASVAAKAHKAVNPADDGPKSPAQVAAKAAKAQARATAKAARRAAKLANGHGVVRYHGPECTGFTAPTYNHGQYVKAHPDDPTTTDKNERQLAAESRCGKPLQAGANTANAGADEDEAKSEKPAKSQDSKKPADTGKPASPGRSEEKGAGPPTSAGS